jgi:hypothetical protein
MEKKLNFIQFLGESKFRELDKNLKPKVKNLIKTYNLIYRKINKTDLKHLSTKVEPGSKWEEYFKDEKVKRFSEIDDIRFRDLKTNKLNQVKVLLAFDTVSSTLAHYDEVNNFIVLFQDNIKYLSDVELEAILIHELTHGFQEYKTASPEYDIEIKKMAKGKPFDKEIYHLEPLEFDAHLTELSYRIKEDYNKLKQSIRNSVLPESKRVFENRLEKFLLEMKLFIKSNPNSYLKYEELPTPKFFSKHQDFLSVISEHPSFWRKLKEKMVGLYFKFTKSFP